MPGQRLSRFHRAKRAPGRGRERWAGFSNRPNGRTGPPFQCRQDVVASLRPAATLRGGTITSSASGESRRGENF
jgi:hypothetical protein